MNNEPPVNRLDELRDIPPVYHDDTVLNKWNISDKTGSTITLNMTVPETLVHPFREFNTTTASRQRLYCVLREPDMPVSGEIGDIVYIGEAMLLFWGDTSSSGMTMRLLLESSRTHPFDGHYSGRNGKKFDTLIWAIDDDETILPKESVKKRRKFVDLSPIVQAGIKCSDASFREWIGDNLLSLIDDAEKREELPDFTSEIPNVKFSEAVVRMFCNVESRAEFKEDTDHGKRAIVLWRKMLTMYNDHLWNRL